MEATFRERAPALLRTAARHSNPARAARMLPLVLLLALPAAARAQFVFTTNNGAITITGYTGPGGAVIIPGSTNGYPVTRIGNDAFSFCFPLTGITIPNSVTNIGDGAFHACSSLTNVALGTNIIRIGAEAFSSCASLAGITLPGSVADIGDRAFYSCTSLGAIMVGTDSPAYSSMDGVLFNKSHTTLIQCPGGKAGTYTVPASVTNIGPKAFSYCTSLANMTMPGSVTLIGDEAFVACRNLTSVVIGSNVTGIGTNAFSWCTGLASVTIPAGVRNIGATAFSWCGSLTNVIVPGTVTNIGERAFYSCASLSAITVDTNSPAYSSVTGVLFNKSQTTLIQCPGAKTGSYTVPASVTNIGSDAFYGCARLTGIYFQGDAPGIGSHAFDDANNAAIYYLPGTTGWYTPFGGRPAMLWNPRAQDLGVRTNRFGFTVTGTANIPIVLEACTNLGGVDWVSLESCTLTNGALYFSDSQWINYPARCYRIRSP